KCYTSSTDATNHFLAAKNEPFSYLVSNTRFACFCQIWGMRGYALADLVKQPLGDNIPQGYDSVRTGLRDIEWRADQGAEVIWEHA
ncbi:glutamyl endopeptidase, partial [Pseudoalteromonas sp. S1691]